MASGPGRTCRAARRDCRSEEQKLMNPWAAEELVQQSHREDRPVNLLDGVDSAERSFELILSVFRGLLARVREWYRDWTAAR